MAMNIINAIGGPKEAQRYFKENKKALLSQISKNQYNFMVEFLRRLNK